MKETELKSGLEGFVEPEAEQSTFTTGEASDITVITLMRIYDLLGAILNEMDEDIATAILERHKQGGLVGPMPALNLSEME